MARLEMKDRERARILKKWKRISGKFANTSNNKKTKMREARLKRKKN